MHTSDDEKQRIARNLEAPAENGDSRLDFRAEQERMSVAYARPTHRIREKLAYLVVGVYLVLMALTTSAAVWAALHNKPPEAYLGIGTTISATFGPIVGAVLVFYFSIERMAVS